MPRIGKNGASANIFPGDLEFFPDGRPDYFLSPQIDTVFIEFQGATAVDYLIKVGHPQDASNHKKLWLPSNQPPGVEAKSGNQPGAFAKWVSRVGRLGFYRAISLSPQSQRDLTHPLPEPNFPIPRGLDSDLRVPHSQFKPVEASECCLVPWLTDQALAESLG